MKKVEDLIVIGAGNPDIVRLIEDINEEEKTYNFIGFLDIDASLHKTEIFGYPVLGDDDLLYKYNECAVVNNVFKTTYLHEIVAEKLINKYGIKNFPNLVHPSINLKYVSIGKGNIIYENVHFGTKVSIENFNIFYPFVMIGHQAILGSYNLLGGNAIISARTIIGDRNEWGVGSILVYYAKVSSDVFVAAGSVVLNSVNKPQRLMGNPAQEIRL